MNSSRLRIGVLALLIGSVSAITGTGLGRLLTKVVLATDKPKSKANQIGGRPTNSSVRVGGGTQKASPSDIAAAAGVRIIYPNPRNLFANRARFNPDTNSPNQGIIPAVTPLPTFNYNVSAYDGNTYTGSIIGRDPTARGKTTTTINVQIIPLIINIVDGARSGTVTYDPTIIDPCIPGSHTNVDVITGSPLFTDNTWMMNGVNVGTTQYIDAFQRAQFWSLVGGTNYHLRLNQSTLSTQTLTFNTSLGTSGGSSGIGQNYDAASLFGGCGSVGVVQIDDLDAAVQGLITGPLAGLVNAGTLPIFLTKSVVSADTGTNIFADCCVLGYHNGLVAGPNLQIYSPFSLDYSGTFGNQNVSTLSHELAEAINDPTINNTTPLWGNIGQTLGQCQGNFEVGDPLSPGFGTPTNEFSILGSNGLTYNLQELAFFGWFFGGTSPGGAGGRFSNNGTFTGRAVACPPGGTN